MDSQSCHAIGDAWLAAGASGLLLVPSAIIPFEQNALINPLYPASARLMVANVMPFL
jgi:RES domain-containing protein